MPGCAVAGCSNWHGKASCTDEALSFHRFPKDEALRKVWINRCCRKDEFNVDCTRICSKHFDDDCFIRDMRNELLGQPSRRILKDDAIPSRHLPYKTSPVKSPSRAQRALKRKSKCMLDDLLASSTTSSSNQHVQHDDQHEVGYEENSCVKCPKLEKENEDLKSECKRLQATVHRIQVEQRQERRKMNSRITFWKELNKKSQSTHREIRQLSRSVKRVFSSGQIECLQRGKSAVRWGREDILSALELRTVSRKAYVYLRNSKKLPLPGISTLRRWVSGYRMTAGLSQFALDILRSKRDRFTTWDRVCVLSFDEMSVNQRLCYDAKEDQILGPHSKVLVFMIRGLLTNWKQPVYYAFDVSLNAALLKSVITAVENVGYDVVVCVCDMAGGNRGLLTSLGVTELHPFFANPVNESRSVWCLSDIPHALKLLRNHFLDHGFTLPSGTIIKKDTIKELMDMDCKELKIVHKLSPLHVNVVGMERHKVRLAAQLFSGTTAAAISYVFPDKMEMSQLAVAAYADCITQHQ